MTLITDLYQREVTSRVKRGRARGRSIWYKRILDYAVVVPGILFLLPAFALISAAVLIADGRPIFFRHKRVGENGKTFNCLKFRTMRKNSEDMLADMLALDEARAKEWNATQKLIGDPRVHPLGRLLRASSLDELPQFFNVIMGDMSLVGPRPVTEDELPRYDAAIGYYLSMKPGITGLWQVSRRADTTYEQRVAMDVEYFRSRSLGRDIVILAKTVGVVLFATNER